VSALKADEFDPGGLEASSLAEFEGLPAVLDQLADSFLLADREGRILHVNPQWERVTGYTLAEIAGKTPRILKSGTHPPEIYRELWNTILDGKPFRFIFTNRKKSGELYEEGVVISPLRGRDGEVTHFLALGRVIDQFRQNYDVYTLLANGSPVGMFVLKDGKYFFVNPAFQAITGRAPEELIGRDYGEVFPEEDREKAKALLRARPVDPNPHEQCVIARNGDRRWALISMAEARFRGIRSVAGEFVTGTALDITDRKRAEERVQEALSLYTATVESTTDGIIVTDAWNQVVAFNTRFLDMWSIPRPAPSGFNAEMALQAILAQIKDPERYMELAVKAKNTSGSSRVTKIELLDGRVMELHCHDRILHGEPQGKVWNFRDVTERERLESTLSRLANYDSLTGLPNRRFFQEELERAILAGEQGAVLFMDVDDFKAINDSLGHTAGDEFLRALAARLSRVVRGGDVLGRLGGDEFAVLLRGSSRAEAMKVAHRLLESVQNLRLVSQEQAISSTVSIGGALFPAHGTSVDELLGHADMAMYRVKQAGRNSLRFYKADLATRASGRSHVIWKQRVLDALEQDRFVLWGQPIFELSTGRLACYELLLRMREPNGNLVLPGRFLGAAESSGLIQMIDAWVTQQSLLIAQKLTNAPRPVNVAFNLSGPAVGHPGILDLFKQGAAALDINPAKVSIEVTETALMNDLARARAFFRSLKDMGFRFALDDFGSGFSSFSRLREVPADYLKIDGSFVEDIATNEENRHFVRAIAQLGSGLGIGAVAEFVEDEASVGILRDLGVVYGQGEFLGPPRPLSQVFNDHGLGESALREVKLPSSGVPLAAAS